jgi:hypothetical protein
MYSENTFREQDLYQSVGEGGRHPLTWVWQNELFCHWMQCEREQSCFRTQLSGCVPILSPVDRNIHFPIL